ncbi:MAG: cysteine desulfurase [Clostridia bacterium]|nr:cysteine desulfurase [Clostridia bacterium]
MIYLDNAATTRPLDKAVAEAERYLKEEYFNPSALYSVGLKVKESEQNARKSILSRFPLGYDLIFTSCGSEADNTAIFSFCKRGNAVTTYGEHSAVYECFNKLKNSGFDARFAALNGDGSVNEEDLLSLVDEKTAFVSVVHVNNETGAVNDIDGLAEKIKRKNPSVIFHSDGVQAFGKIPRKISDKIDLYSISAHKINGVKGVGALVKKKNINITPLIYGGGQENGLRSGTENVFGITSFGIATEECFKNIESDYLRIGEIKEKFREILRVDGVRFIADKSSPYILSLSAVGLRGEVVQHMMEDFGVVIGTGSACSSRKRHSRILSCCGYDDKTLDGALRISFSRFTTEEEAIFAAEKLKECILKLKGVMKV